MRAFTWSRRGLPSRAQAQCIRGRLALGPPPHTSHLPESRAHRRSSAVARAALSCWCARLRCAPFLALAQSRPRLLSSGAPGIKAAADTGLRAEGPVVTAQGGLCEERTGGAQGPAFGVDLQERRSV